MDGFQHRAPAAAGRGERSAQKHRILERDVGADDQLRLPRGTHFPARGQQRSATWTAIINSHDKSANRGVAPSWPGSRAVPGRNGVPAGARSQSPRTRSRDCSGRTTSPPSMSAPRTLGVKGTSALSSSTCSETCLGLDHPPASSNRAAALEEMEADL